MYFSWEEWALLDKAQKLLYCDAMLENFALMASLGKTLIPAPVYFPFPHGQIKSFSHQDHRHCFVPQFPG